LLLSFFDRNLLFFLDLRNMRFNSLRFIPQARQMIFQLNDSLLFSHKSRPQIRRVIASTETGILMNPSLKSLMTASSTTHGFTPFQNFICEHTHILI
jgi:hypothetical protein